MFEWIERLHIDVDAGTARGEARVPAGHALLADHFPGLPVLPATLLIELAAQVAGPLAEEITRRRHGVERWAVLSVVRQAAFTRPTPLPAHVVLDARSVRVDPRAVLLAVTAAASQDAEPPMETLRAELLMAMVEAQPGWDAALRARRERIARWSAPVPGTGA